MSQGLNVFLESKYKQEVFNGLSQLGHKLSKKDYTSFGGGQIIYKLEDGYLGASDWRKDGSSVGL
ncbi:MAG: hypothetical protein ACFFG0_46335 [Candidatus Thorarchaeota archaeon]